MVNPQGKVTTFTYDGARRNVCKDHANGAVTTQAFDAAGNMDGITNAKGDGTVISRTTYTYDA